MVILAGLFGIYKVVEYRDISSPEQILSLQAYEDRLVITTDLPFYRSVVGYTIGNSPDGNDTIELSVSSQIDLSLDHQQKIVVETDSLEEDMGIRSLKTVDIVDQNGIIKTFEL